MAKVRIDGISNEIAKALQEFTEEVEEGLEKAKEKVVKDGVKTLKKTSPSNTGRYKKGWRATKQDGAMVVHNAERPSLTHLLENGHAKRNGGRVGGIPHIAPVEQSMIDAFEKEVERVVKK